MIKLELTDQMIAIIGEALGSAPYKIAAPVIAELQKQINDQQPKSNGKEVDEPTQGWPAGEVDG